MFSKIFVIIWIYLKRIYRDKRFVLISVISPFILVLLVGAIFSTEDINNIRMGLILGQKAPDIITRMKDRVNFSVEFLDYEDTDDCIGDIKIGNVHGCLVFPEGLNEVDIYTDFSKVALADVLVGGMTSAIIYSAQEMEVDVIRNILLAMENIQAGFNNMLTNLGSMKEEALKIKNSVNKIDVSSAGVDFSSIRNSIAGFGLKIDNNKEGLSGLKADISNSRGIIEGMINDLGVKKQALINETVSCTEARMLIEISKIDYECEEEGKNIENYTYLLYVPCDEYLSMIRSNIELLMCDVIMIVDSVLDEKMKILKNRTSEIDSAVSNLEGMKNEISNSEHLLGNFMQEMELIKVSLKNINITLTQSEQKFGTESQQIGEIKTSVSDTLDSVLDSIEENERIGSENFKRYGTALAGKGVLGNQTTVVGKSVVSAKRQVDFLYLIAFVLLLSFSCVLISSSVIIKEKTSPAFFRNYISPTHNILFFLGMFIVNHMISLLYSLTFLGFLIMNEFYTPINLFDAIVVILVVQSCLILIGMLIAVLFEKRESALLGTTTILIVLTILSGALIPIEKMSNYFYMIASYSPLALIMEAFRKALLFNMSISQISVEISGLLIFSVAFFTMFWYLNRIRIKF